MLMRWTGSLLICGLLAAPAAAQDRPAQDQQVPYRAQLSACLENDDYTCAYDVLMAHGESNGFTPVAVSLEGGPTVFGSLLFAVIDRSAEALDPETRRAMAEQAISYVFDAQPEDGFAAGPYLLLLAEICREQQDRTCVITAGRSVQLFLEQEVWYFDGSDIAQGDKDVRTRAEEIVRHYEEITQ